jgi:hypothetical protein
MTLEDRKDPLSWAEEMEVTQDAEVQQIKISYKPPNTQRNSNWRNLKLNLLKKARVEYKKLVNNIRINTCRPTTLPYNTGGNIHYTNLKH